MKAQTVDSATNDETRVDSTLQLPISTNDVESDLKNVSYVSGKRSREMMSEEERKEERKAANRRSAYQSRLRKKLLIEELQGKVASLSETIQKLRHENLLLTRELEGALAENRRLRFMQYQQDSLMGAGAGMGLQGAPSIPPFMDTTAMQLQQNYGGLMGPSSKLPGLDPFAASAGAQHR